MLDALRGLQEPAQRYVDHEKLVTPHFGQDGNLVVDAVSVSARGKRFRPVFIHNF